MVYAGPTPPSFLITVIEAPKTAKPRPFSFWVLSFVQGAIRDQHTAVEIDALHFFLARKRTPSFRSDVFTARNDTVSPDFVLNLTVVGFFTVLVATNLTLFCAING